MQYTSARIKQTTKEKIKKTKEKLKLSSDDEVINHWEAKARLFEQLTKNR